MGLFGLFGSNKDNSEREQKELPWKRLTSVDQLSQIVAESKTKPVAIFKHSTRCGISRMVLRNFEGTYDLDPENMHLYYLDLLAYRDVSDEVGFRFQVLHQSPQLIVIKNGVAVAHASHHGIRAEELVNFV
ncbi:bacillithiol system redox-active protein YtxJ [Aureisphaera galaxeae]|uniref:bacillithiol system redox-active protein YtxJ n=1 Tax=Aureisphaera galaxeae TaxID=1538023 RepID=UPI00235001DB|nr:bacillithiol system redox-active protein YtxJ [Aureisphaera galaxeae]MDC8004937.1 bacillithiol system redox-active protein YtxJ [Aureisphaera galaxeae]